MKVNYMLDENNYIVTLRTYPFIDSDPYLDLTDKELSEITHGITRIINGKLNNDKISNFYISDLIQDKKNKFREFRNKYLEKYDLLGLCIMREDLDPETGLVYEPLTQEERQWRVNMLNFTKYINENTTKEDYPKIPKRLQ